MSSARRHPGLRLLLLVLVLSAQHAAAAPGDSYALVPAFPHLGFTRPLAIVDPMDGTHRLFVVEQAGRIYVFDNSPSVQRATLFLDIRARVQSAGNEEGLLGLAFHPQFARNGRFYVNYTAPHPRRTVIACFTLRRDDPRRADPDSELRILEFDQPYANHNGGQLQFGPDGYLYIGTGDGGDAGDPHNNGQSLTTLLGKILRIDVDARTQGRRYAIPPDNPFAGSADKRSEIWAYGLRNPWRFSFDAPTGLLWAGDVGQDSYEEVDIVRKGRNYGWRIMEGYHCFNPSHGCDTAGLEMPVWEYDHEQGVCIIGGVVYRGARIPSLTGAYLCADYGSGRMWALRSAEDGRVRVEEILRTNQPITSFGVDRDQNVYVTSFDGRVYRLDK